MKKLTFKCRIITPLFMFGADGKTPELRPSEFKGMMRFWWRAIKAEDNIENLRKEEASLFGGTGEGEGKSRVRIRVIPEKLEYGRYRPLPHSETKRFTFPCIKENSEFTVILLTEKDPEFYRNIFILTCILGGFGRRSRRGFGSIEILNLDQKITLNYIKELLLSINKRFEIESSKIINKSREAKGNYPWIREIEIGSKGSPNMENILRKIGKASHKFKDPSLGNANPRMASPIYVSIIKDGGLYKPIIITLNSSFPPSYSRWNFGKQINFRGEILNG